MAISTSQQLTRYYDQYRNIDVTFTKEVIDILGLQAQHIFIKAEGQQWPCVINSSSLVGTKVIAGSSSRLISRIQKDTAAISVRFSFVESENKEPVSFFINSKLLGISPYGAKNDLILIHLQYLQRAPDLLIEKLGFLLESNENSTKRRDEKVLITPDTMRKMGIVRKETLIYIQGVPRRCVLRDISFAGAKVVTLGVAHFMQDKEMTLKVDFEEPRVTVELHGKVIRTEDVRGRRDLIAIAVSFFEHEVPISYKMRLNGYITTQSRLGRSQAEIDDHLDQFLSDDLYDAP